MRSHINNGIVAGLLGGVVFGIMMQMMNAPTPEGGQMPMMAMVAMSFRGMWLSIRHGLRNAPAVIIGKKRVIQGQLPYERIKLAIEEELEKRDARREKVLSRN
ncbi:MAG: hypothetical protein HY695_05910 [Deltaproteobacteria bacterium]|nr:hypothetical protein [Deltaproteobacteria bacterium]